MHQKNCLAALAAAVLTLIAAYAGAAQQPAEQGKTLQSQTAKSSAQIARELAEKRGAMTREERLASRRKVIVDTPKKDPKKAVQKPQTRDQDDAALEVENEPLTRLPESSAQRLSRETREAIAARKGKAPSPAFKNFFTPWAVKLGHMRLLHNSVSDLLRQYPDCRDVPSQGSALNPIVACGNPRAFGAEGDVVIFEYLPSNDALSGAEYYFSNERKARAYATLILREIRGRVDTFRDAASTWGYDSPLFRVQVFPTGEGALVKVKAHQTEALNGFDVYGKARVKQIDFGSLVVGATRLEQLPPPTEDCEKITGDLDQHEQEFYGTCFGFPMTAHYHLSFDKTMNTLKTIALTPLQSQTSALIESALTHRYGEPKHCSRIKSSVRIARLSVKRLNEPHPTSTLDRIREEPSSVYLGECSEPILFTVGPRYVFVYDRISAERIEQDYLARKADNDLIRTSQSKLARRKNELDGFF